MYSTSRGSWTLFLLALFIVGWFPCISIYASRQLNVIDFGAIVLVTTTPLKCKELPKVTHFGLLYTDIVSCDVHSNTPYGPKHNYASGK